MGGVRPGAFALVLALVWPSYGLTTPVVEQRLGAYLFGQPVGEVVLTLSEQNERTTLAYRSHLRVVRNRERLTQTADIEVVYSERLLRARSRRCTGDACTPEKTLRRRSEAPSLAAELLLARKPPGEHCLSIVDEETGVVGKACASVAPEPAGGRVLEGTKFDQRFRARVDARGMLVFLELPEHGARFEAIAGALVLSDADLFAEAVPVRGDVREGLLKGALSLRLTAPAAALDVLERLQAPAQRLTERDGSTIVVRTTARRVPKTGATRRRLDAVSRLIAQAKGNHDDCQAATDWFITEARQRGWGARPAIGLAWVDGRFAFHAWALLETPDGLFPIDPLLGQVPADAGHIQLAEPGVSAGELFVAFRRGLSIQALED